MTADNNTCHRIKKFCWRSNPKSPGLLFWVFYFRRTKFSTQGNNVFLHSFKTHQVCTYQASIQESGLNFKLYQLSPTNSKHLAQLSEWGLQGRACAPRIPDTAGITWECKERPSTFEKLEITTTAPDLWMQQLKHLNKPLSVLWLWREKTVRTDSERHI